jgi:hypothetical protein
LKEITRKPALTGLIAVIILVLAFSYYCAPSQAQTIKTFTTADKFSIPDLNGTINFAVNGSYSEATLNNNTWIFTDLTLNNQSIPGFGLNDFHSVGNLTVSTQGSNVTILAYLTVNNSFSASFLSYTVEGKGKQMVNFDLNSTGPSQPAEWSVIVPKNVVLVEGQGWTLLRDNTLIVTSAASNVTIAHFGLNLPAKSNLPFYIQHSVALTTAAVLAIVATLVLAVRVRTIKRK